jgi:hypothetical protein
MPAPHCESNVPQQNPSDGGVGSRSFRCARQQMEREIVGAAEATGIKLQHPPLRGAFSLRFRSKPRLGNCGRY